MVGFDDAVSVCYCGTCEATNEECNAGGWGLCSDGRPVSVQRCNERCGKLATHSCLLVGEPVDHCNSHISTRRKVSARCVHLVLVAHFVVDGVPARVDGNERRPWPQRRSTHRRVEIEGEVCQPWANASLGWGQRRASRRQRRFACLRHAVHGCTGRVRGEHRVCMVLCIMVLAESVNRPSARRGTSSS